MHVSGGSNTARTSSATRARHVASVHKLHSCTVRVHCSKHCAFRSHIWYSIECMGTRQDLGHSQPIGDAHLWLLLHKLLMVLHSSLGQVRRLLLLLLLQQLLPLLLPLCVLRRLLLRLRLHLPLLLMVMLLLLMHTGLLLLSLRQSLRALTRSRPRRLRASRR